MDKSYDVIVIGSGIGGLVAALTCARSKRSVLMLEAGKQFGGYTNPFARKRFHFDPGIHYIGESGEGGSFRRLLDRLELIDVQFQELDPDGFDHYVFPDYQVKNCRGLDRFRDRLAADFPQERRGLDRFFKLLRDADFVIKSTGRPSPRMIGRLLRALPGVARWGRSTVADMLHHYFDDGRLKAALAGPVGDLGLPPTRLSAVMHLGLLTHYANGAYIPKGGGGALRDAFIEGLKEEGADLARNYRVDEILTEGGRAVGVRTSNGDVFRAKTVISNAQATTTYKMVGLDHLSGRMQRKVAKTEHSCGSLVVFLGVNGSLDTANIGSSNIWNYESSDLSKMFGAWGDGASDSYFLTVPTNKDPQGGLAPEGKQTVEIVTLCPPGRYKQWFDAKTMKRGPEYEAIKREIGDHYIGLAEKHLPGLADSIEIQEVGTPATNFAFTLSPDGNIYGPAHTPSQSPPFRFATRTPVDGLFLCGASVLSAGIVSCASSGRAAGKAALADLNAKTGAFPLRFGRRRREAVV